MLASPHEREVSTAYEPVLLVVTTDPRIHALFGRLFQAEYRLRFALEAPAALEALRQETVDLLVLDLTTPEYDGLGVLNQIRTSDCGSSLPVILISELSN